MHVRIFALLASVAMAGLPAAASATTIFGSLGNFDAVNNTGSVAHGFEIELEGIHASNVTDTFGGPGRGFPTTVERYGAPTITEYNNGSSFGVRVTYSANLSGAPTSWIGTPSGVYSTPGESCWTGGGSGYGAATPCDHFGVGLSANPTRTGYSWLVEQTPGSATLINATSNVLAPTWTVTPQAPVPGNPAPPPVIVAQIVAPPPKLDGPEPQFGTAVWAKVFTTEIDRPIALEDLVGGNAFVQQAEQHTETEWQLLQTDPGNPLSGILENGGAAPAGNNAQSIIRRYEFYSFTGLYDAVSHEAQFGNGFGDSNPGPGDVGDFIGAQNAALNFVAPAGIGGVPEPANWAMLMLGFGGIGGMARARRRRQIAV
ncbi:MAG: PEP-CTERM sorting domain-containing protein [Alphaproteobacteria bacterium PA4]|nr:MAG: PEP-CTERM sorting domain-containing protein [Alphaproteobacteria bacterium PA4]